MRYEGCMIRITPHIILDDSEILESFIRSSGPGGQNVNKVSTAVELRFDAQSSTNLAEDVKLRLLKLAGQRATKDGVIVITADEHRLQSRNREAALARLVELIRDAAHKPKPRRPTKPTYGSQIRRMDSKTKHGATKSTRSAKPDME
jgi:ribosome-associated protein